MRPAGQVCAGFKPGCMRPAGQKKFPTTETINESINKEIIKNQEAPPIAPPPGLPYLHWNVFVGATCHSNLSGFSPLSLHHHHLPSFFCCLLHFYNFLRIKWGEEPGRSITSYLTGPAPNLLLGVPLRSTNNENKVDAINLIELIKLEFNHSHLSDQFTTVMLVSLVGARGSRDTTLWRTIFTQSHTKKKKKH